MLTASRSLLLVVLSLLSTATIGGLGLPTGHGFAPTLEPTLALSLDLSLHGLERGHGHARARLEIDLTAAEDLSGIELSLVLPPGLDLVDRNELPRQALALRKGVRRRFELSVRGRDGQLSPIGLTALFRTPDGRSFTLRQGIDLLPWGGPPAGRSNAGAFEVMAVPLEELRR